MKLQHFDLVAGHQVSVADRPALAVAGTVQLSPVETSRVARAVGGDGSACTKRRLGELRSPELAVIEDEMRPQ
jgi:hypothetical protein